MNNHHTKHSILYADDHPVMHLGVSGILRTIEGISLIDARPSDGEEAKEMIAKFRPNVVLLDLSMPKTNGIEVARWIVEEEYRMKIILFSNFIPKDIFESGLQLGINGFLLKQCALEEIEECLFTIIKGKRYISPLCYEAMVKAKKEYVEKFVNNQPDISLLTKRELEVLQMIAQGKSSTEIADGLFNSKRTIDTHRYRIARKLNMEGKNSLMQFAIEHRDWLLTQ